MYTDANWVSSISTYMDSNWSWFTCFRKGAWHEGQNNIWYYSQGDRPAGVWGYMPALDVWTSTDPWPGMPECPVDSAPPPPPPPPPPTKCGVGDEPWNGWFSEVGCSSDPNRQCYPVQLHGRTVILYTGRRTAKAYASAGGLGQNDILSIDRSRNAFIGNDLDHKWPYTHQVAANGGWDYCEDKSGRSTQKTPTVDGYQHAVRVCLRRNGALQCSNVWYSDQNR